MQGKVLGKSGGFNINGIIEEYTVVSGGNVSAGDFVKFVNEIGTDTQLSTNTNQNKAISAVALSQNKVFIAHSTGSTDSYGVVCTISGTTITAGTEILLSLNGSSIISAVALSENKVFIAHSTGQTTYLFGIICTISGTTITVGTNTRLSINTIYGISATALSENKVFIAYCRNESNTYYLYGIMCTINGTTITAGTNTQLITVNTLGFVISATALSENKVFIAWR